MMVRLGDVCAISASAKENPDEYVWLLNLDMVEQQTGRVLQYVYVPKEEAVGSIIRFDTDNVLYSKLRPNLNKVVLPAKDGFATSELLPLRPDTTVLCKEYLATYLRSGVFVTWAVSKATGAKMPRLASKELLNKAIPLPSIAEQKRIASVIGTMDNLIALHKRQLAKLDELVKARFVEMFGDIISNSQLWPVFTLDKISSSRLGKMLDAKQQTGKNRFPYLANYNVQWFHFELDNLRQMDFSTADQEEFSLQDGDLLICEGGEIGRCAIWHNQVSPCFFQKAIHRVRCNAEVVTPEYLSYWFNFHANFNAFEDVVGSMSTIAHLTGEKLKELEIPVPSIQLQRDFSAFVEQVEKSRLTIRRGLDKMETLKRALMQEYFR